MEPYIDIFVSEEDLVENIQIDFAFYYPYLKLQFFTNPHGEKEASAKQDLLSSQLPISEIAMFHKSGRINISPIRKTSQVENDFYFQLGLNVQVFRKAGALWLETTKTDDLSLKVQNEMGKNACGPMPATIPVEFDLQDGE